jgi:hypothetical protein
MDTRFLALLLDDAGGIYALCDLAVNFGAKCVPCGSDGLELCLPLLITELRAEEVGFELVRLRRPHPSVAGSPNRM